MPSLIFLRFEEILSSQDLWEILDLLDTTPAPDTILYQWGADDRDVILFGQKPLEINPDVPLFAGDMGAYIG